MTFQELCQMVSEYQARYNCGFADAIDDLEFDGPEGSSGPTERDRELLMDHFIPGWRGDDLMPPSASKEVTGASRASLNETQRAIVQAALRMYLNQQNVRGVSLADGEWVAVSNRDILDTASCLQESIGEPS